MLYYTKLEKDKCNTWTERQTKDTTYFALKWRVSIMVVFKYKWLTLYPICSMRRGFHHVQRVDLFLHQGDDEIAQRTFEKTFH